mgnify:CR=1 FL=1
MPVATIITPSEVTGFVGDKLVEVIVRDENGNVLPGDQNKGGKAACAALHLIALARKFANEHKKAGFKVGMDFN